MVPTTNPQHCDIPKRLRQLSWQGRAGRSFAQGFKEPSIESLRQGGLPPVTLTIFLNGV